MGAISVDLSSLSLGAISVFSSEQDGEDDSDPEEEDEDKEDNELRKGTEGVEDGSDEESEVPGERGASKGFSLAVSDEGWFLTKNETKTKMLLCSSRGIVVVTNLCIGNVAVSKK